MTEMNGQMNIFQATIQSIVAQMVLLQGFFIFSKDTSTNSQKDFLSGTKMQL